NASPTTQCYPPSLHDALPIWGRPLRAVQRAGEDARGGGLATAARAGEEVRVVDPAAAQRLDQRLGDVLLPDHLGKGARTVLAVRSEEHTSELQSRENLVCRLL